LYLTSIRDKLDIQAKSQILQLLDSNPYYGHRRVGLALNWSKHRARRIMRKFNIYPKYKRPGYLVKRGDLNTTTAVNSNLLKPILEAKQLTKPNLTWSGDFTYLKYKTNFLYLATIIDCYTKEIVGFQIHNQHNQELVLGALKMALKYNPKPIIFHSDQGSEYTSQEYQQELQRNQIQTSYSKKSSPWENGFQESFYGKFKLELGNLNQYPDLVSVIEAICKQIYYYNHHRIHTSIKSTPINFRRMFEISKSTKKEKNSVSSFSWA